MDAPLISAARYNANRDASMRQPAECIRCGATITEEGKGRAHVSFDETGERAYWQCGDCAAALRRELDSAPY